LLGKNPRREQQRYQQRQVCKRCKAPEARTEAAIRALQS
jgi:hypothetical protein